ncbi:6-phosphogluconate dehydrogenase, decarboxylating, partial [Dictyocoela muelleri]
SNFKLQTSNFKLQTSNFKLQTSNFKLQTSNFKLQTSNFKLQTSKTIKKNHFLNLMDIGIIGMGVMGRNLALNIRDKGYKISVYNRTHSKMDLIDGVKKCYLLKEFVDSLSVPRKIIIMVQDKAVESIFNELKLLILPEDIVVDCGNSNYKQSERLKINNCGVSGGEEGARKGPSMMFGGDFKAYKMLEKIFKDISAKVKIGDKEIYCFDYMGEGGAGHFVKMVHNGIEYGIMELISEVYLLKGSVAFLKKSFNSYLIEISDKILKFPERIEEIKDCVSQKGTGIWCLQSATEEFPSPILASAIFSRQISGLSEIREIFSKKIPLNDKKCHLDDEDVTKAYVLATTITYLEGLMIIKNHLPDIDLKKVLKTWRNGCIIRSEIIDTLEKIDKLESEEFLKIVQENLESLKNLVICGVKHEIAIPCFSAALNFINSLRNKGYGAFMALMRDLFGAHTVTLKNGESKHYDWND